MSKHLARSFEKRDNQHESLDEDNTEMPLAASSTPYEQMIERDRINLVRQLVNSLPEKQRSCMQLRDFEGKAYKEIANILSISEEQVKVNIFRARQAIKQQYQKLEQYGL